MTDPTNTTPDAWKETVRDIYDKVLLGKDSGFFGNPLAVEILKLIEAKHHAYFCEGSPP